MLVTISLIVIGVIALFAMIMMIGNVLTKSKYGRTWALIAGASVLMAGLLMVVQMFAPQAEAEGSTDKASTEETQQAQTDAAPADTVAADQGTQTVDTQDAAAAEDQNLAFLSVVLDKLKNGEPIPDEYLAMLPDGGQSIKAQQAKNAASGTASSTLSKPLLQQLVSIARSQGKTVNSPSSYVPTTTIAALPAPANHSAASQQAAPASTNRSNSGNGSTAAPAQQPPAQQPAPAPAPAPKPAPAPQPAPKPTTPAPKPTTPAQPASGVLADGGLMKSVLGKSKADVKSFFQYNQFISETDTSLSYLRGSMVVDVTFSGGQANQVTMTFNRFTPPNKDMDYYESYMLGVSGMTKAEPSSRSGQDLRWNGVYPGASSVQFHIDTNANSGYIKVSR